MKTLGENLLGATSMNDDRSTPAGYEAPCIEQVLTAEELDRELHYAGTGSPV